MLGVRIVGMPEFGDKLEIIIGGHASAFFDSCTSVRSPTLPTVREVYVYETSCI